MLSKNVLFYKDIHIQKDSFQIKDTYKNNEKIKSIERHK